MSAKAYRLKNLRLKRVSLVDNPANEESLVVLFKSNKMSPTSTDVHTDGFAVCKNCGAKVSKEAKACQKCGTSMSKQKARSEEIKMEELEKVKADLEEMEAKAAEEETKRVEAEKKVTTLEKEVARLKAAQGPEEAERLKMAALPEEVRKQLEEQGEMLQKMRDEKAETEMIAKVQTDLKGITAKPENLGKILKHIQENKCSPEEFSSLWKLLKAQAEQSKRSFLWQEIGRTSEDEPSDSIIDKVDRLAETIVTKSGNKVSLEDARGRVFQEHPEYYQAYRRGVTVPVGAGLDSGE